MCGTRYHSTPGRYNRLPRLFVVMAACCLTALVCRMQRHRRHIFRQTGSQRRRRCRLQGLTSADLQTTYLRRSSILRLLTICKPGSRLYLTVVLRATVTGAGKSPLSAGNLRSSNLYSRNRTRCCVRDVAQLRNNIPRRAVVPRDVQPFAPRKQDVGSYGIGSERFDVWRRLLSASRHDKSSI
jgi:hypothetical protein